VHISLQWKDSTVSAQADISYIRSDVSADQPAILQPTDMNRPNSDPDADTLQMPEPQIRNRNSRRTEKFFILTSAEACSKTKAELERGPVPNVMAALPNIGGTLCESSVIPFLVPRRKLADAHCSSGGQ